MHRGLWGDRVKGILHTLNDDKGERVEAREGSSRVIWGDSTVTEVLHGLSFGISMGSFFQTNPTSAERLYAEVLALALEGVENHRKTSSWTCLRNRHHRATSWRNTPTRLWVWTLSPAPSRTHAKRQAQRLDRRRVCRR